MTSILAIYEKGMFRPVGEVPLEEGATVRVLLPETGFRSNREKELGYPPGFFEKFAGALAHEQMERPAQPPLDGDPP